MKIKSLFTLGLIILHFVCCLSVRAQGSSLNSFTYQGRLNDANGPANGLYDFSFTLFSAGTGGSQVGTTVSRGLVPVTNGLFTVALEFLDANSFSGADRWLEIAVRRSGVGTNIILSPRQQITATPYANRAAQFSGPVAASQITGAIASSNIGPGSITGAMLAEGAVSSVHLQPGAALANLLGSGSASVTPGGIVMSDDPTNTALNYQGYVRMPNAEMTLTAEKWTKLNPPAASAEFIAARGGELSVNTGSELIIFRFDSTDYLNDGTYSSMHLVETIRYNPATGQWSKGAAPPQAVVAEGATAVWTGSKVIIWGGEERTLFSSGFDSHTEYVNPTGALVYSPTSDQWTIVAGSGAIPEGRRFHSAIWTGSRMLVWGGEKVVHVSLGFNGSYYTREDLNTGASFDPTTGVWTVLSTNSAPSIRRGHVAVWTGTRMLVQGGTKNNRGSTTDEYSFGISATNVFNNGASYNPVNDTWSPIRSDGTAPRQAFAQAVWTGSEMFTFGGVDVNYVYVSDPNYGNRTLWLWVPGRAGNSYNFTNDFWTFRGVPDSSGTNINGRRYGTLAWTGTEVIACGGEGLNETNYEAYARTDAQAYNMSSGTWRTLPTAPLQGGVGSQSAWIGNQLLVSDPSSSVNPARAAYSPSSNSWSVLPNYFGQAPLRQDDPSAVWTGKEFIIWGGPVNGVASNRGRSYNPATGVWKEISTTNAPAARMRHSAVWTGTRMIIWGGDGGGDPLYPAVIYSSGGAYDPVTDTWTTLPAAPFDPFVGDSFRRTGHRAVWTVYGMVVVGGSDGYNSQGQNFTKTIARLSPNLTSWTLSSNTNPLLARFGHCLGTDGLRRVFLWGGQYQTTQDPVGVGMLIDAFTLSAGDEVDNADEPQPARNPSIAWNGTEFIVWGGTDASGQPLGGGSKFNPTGGYWTAPSQGGPVLTTTHAGHVAVWSGTEMLVWGGSTNQFGARFNPRNDAWNAMAVGPVMRAGARGAWTGTNMLLYLPALPSQGSIPELWQYVPPSKVYFYLKQ